MGEYQGDNKSISEVRSDANKYQKIIANQNLAQSNCFYLLIEAKDERMNVKDIIFRLKNFPLPDMSIPIVVIPTLVQKIPFPSQGHLEYGDLTLDLLVDDNLNNYIELCKWVYRIDNPEYLFSRNNDESTFLEYPKAPYLRDLETTDQYPIDYRDINVLVANTNGQFVHRFNFAEAFPVSISNLQINVQAADYMSLTATFKFLVMTVWDMEGNKIL